MHQKCWTTTNRSYFMGIETSGRWARFAIHILDSKGTKIHINTDSGRYIKVFHDLYRFFDKTAYAYKARSWSTAKLLLQSGFNQMWTSRIQRHLLEHLKSPTFNRVTSIKSWIFPLFTQLSPDISRQTHQYYPKCLHVKNGNFDTKNWY